MKLHQLRTLNAVVNTGGIRAAARALGVSSTAVTKALQELEADLGVQLLHRHSGGVSLTEYGRALHVHAKSVLKQLERADSEIRMMRGANASKLTIGVTPWVALTFLPPTVIKFRALMPEVKLEFYEGLLAVVQPLLRDGTLDFSIGRTPDEPVRSEFQTVPLFSSQAAIVGRKDHPKRNCRTLHELTDAEWLLTWDPAGEAPMLETLFRKHGVQVPETIHLAHSVSVGLGLLTQTDMLGVYPWPLVEIGLMRDELAALPLREVVDQSTVCIMSRRDVRMSPAASYFFECFREVIHEMERSSEPNKRRLFHSLEVLL
ncbi:LysR substrate-binding domain-containing protein [Paraburkholderia susongensis]|uniref:DNA-binding transcriptional regulator, LysR family n=1 Tax=Paraburkholderia susongensis TaxID=1515439 RepID=A0A1X7ICG2_9BURK|nr:LysR substrate-binding domain-containing protein [Paraburkholderia susongensis]SMG11932.1 DNA-binding transcriptional regulator, LysR family [Paraburkholderia susongensis]